MDGRQLTVGELEKLGVFESAGPGIDLQAALMTSNEIILPLGFVAACFGGPVEIHGLADAARAARAANLAFIEDSAELGRAQLRADAFIELVETLKQETRRLKQGKKKGGKAKKKRKNRRK